MTPSLSADGVASKEAVKDPVCVVMACDCQEAELTKQPGVPVVFVRLKLADVATPDAAVTA
jgi:hypothetical protein